MLAGFDRLHADIKMRARWCRNDDGSHRLVSQHLIDIRGRVEVVVERRDVRASLWISIDGPRNTHAIQGAEIADVIRTPMAATNHRDFQACIFLHLLDPAKSMIRHRSR